MNITNNTNYNNYSFIVNKFYHLTLRCMFPTNMTKLRKMLR